MDERYRELDQVDIEGVVDVHRVRDIPPQNTFVQAHAQIERAWSGSSASSAAREPSPEERVYYVGVTTGATTPTGGVDVGAGAYLNTLEGRVGVYRSAGPSVGIPTVGAGVTLGFFDSVGSLSGNSTNLSAGLGLLSANLSFDAQAGRLIGASLTLGPSFGGKNIPASSYASFTNTNTTHLGSFYNGYLRFLEWIQYPSY